MASNARSCPGTCRGSGSAPNAAFTLVELLVVIGVLGLLGALVLPAIARSVSTGKRGFCTSNLRVLHTAYVMYLSDHDGRFFPFREDLGGGKGTLFYFGLDPGGGMEGNRPLDMGQARLAPYLGNGGTVEICPAMPYKAAYFKRKYQVASYGYGINVYLLDGMKQNRDSGVRVFSAISKPAETIAWGDAVQINDFQPPATAKKPLYEEWYYLTTTEATQKYHFRHDRRVNLVFCDGSVRSSGPDRLDPRCDGLVGALEPGKQDSYLNTAKR